MITFLQVNPFPSFLFSRLFPVSRVVSSNCSPYQGRFKETTGMVITILYILRYEWATLKSRYITTYITVLTSLNILAGREKS